MVSYRTIIFGTIAVISATSPAYAGGGSPIPGHVRQATIAAPAGGSPIPGGRQAMTGGSPIPGPVAFVNALVRDAEAILHINH